MNQLKSNPTECPGDELLAAYVDGILHQDKADRIEKHLTKCKECMDAVVLASLSEKKRVAFQEAAPADMILKAKNLIQPKEKASFRETFSQWSQMVTAPPMLAAVSVLLLIVVVGGYGINKIQRQPGNIAFYPMLNVIAGIPATGGVRSIEHQFEPRLLKEGDTLASGSFFKLRFQLEKAGYVYLISADSKNNINRLMPDPVYISAKITHVYPENGSWLKLDDDKGRETFYLLAAESPIPDFDIKFKQLKTSGIKKISQLFPETAIQTFELQHN
jgi:hypothetical protein